MPCESPPPDTSWVGPAIRRAKERTDEVTRHLCFLCGSLEKEGLLRKFASKPLLAWWAEHQRADDKRVRKSMQDYCIKQLREIHNDDPFGDLEPKDVAEHFIKKAEAVHPVSDFHKNWFHEMAEEFVKEAEKALKQEKSDERKRALKKLTPSERRALGIKEDDTQ